MGEIRIPVRIQAMSQDGDLSSRGPIDVEALLDTGASMTVVSASVAVRAGIVPMGRRIPVVGATGGSRMIETGLALVMTGRCVERPLVIGIDDMVTRNAGAEIVLGHEYMQTARMALRPYAHAATCPAPRRTAAKRGAAARR